MSFIDRELSRIKSALSSQSVAEFERLWAVQQALSWVTEPTGYASPYAAIMGIQEDSEDCPASSRPVPFSNTHVRCE